MRWHRWLAAWLVACALGETQARAHFLFIRIGPTAEAGRSAEVYFSEQAEAGDTRFIDKVAHTKLWSQSTPGTFQPLPVHKATDRLRAPLPAATSLAVIGVCEYGVLARPNRTPFRLRYYPKAVAGRPAELNRLTPRGEVPFEITATFEAGRVKLHALRRGAPQPGARFHIVDSDLTESEVTASADGAASWRPPAPGRYSIYVREDLKHAGELGGTHYDEIREFATLSFEWPLDPKGADLEAVALFEDALAHRSQWKDFPGFSSEVSGSLDGRPFAGRVSLSEEGTVEVKIDDAAARPWVKSQIESIAMHRIAEDRNDSAAPSKLVLRFADDQDKHPLGRLLTVEGGQFASSYRVKDHQISVVNRHVGSRTMTITVIDNDKNAEGQFLPRSYLVHYWDAKSGALDRVETVQDRWRRVGSWDLPSTHSVVVASGAGLSVRTLSLTGHILRETARTERQQ